MVTIVSLPFLEAPVFGFAIANLNKAKVRKGNESNLKTVGKGSKSGLKMVGKGNKTIN